MKLIQTMPSTTHKVIKRISLLIPLCCLLIFFYMAYVRQSYTRRMPEQPSPEQHRVTAISVNYGKTVYVTQDEASFIHNLYYLSMAAGIIFMVGAKIYQHPEMICRKKHGKAEPRPGPDR